MSRVSMLAAAADLPRPPLYGIATYYVESEEHEFAIGWDEFERDTQWAESMMRAAGLAAGDLVLITSKNTEGPWVGPLVRALRNIGVTYLTAEVYEWDARRTAMFLQRLPIKAIVGLGAATVLGLQSAGQELDDLLRGVQVVWARPDAREALAATPPEVIGFARLGPALGLGRPGCSGVLLDAAEWAVDTVAGQLVVTNTRGRATQFDRAPTGVHGRVGAVGVAITIELD